MIVLVADQFEQSGIDGLKAAGCEVVLRRRSSTDDDAGRGAAAHARRRAASSARRKSPPAMMDAGPLALIVRAGAGYNTIDVAAASARGHLRLELSRARTPSPLPSWPSACCSRSIAAFPTTSPRCAPGTWNKKEFSKAAGLKGTTLGLLGYRRDRSRDGDPRARASACTWRSGAAVSQPVRPISPRWGWTTAQRARRSRSRPRRRRGGGERHPERARRAGAGNARDWSAPRCCARLKPGAFFINTARAEVVDYAALEAAVAAKGLRVALDVFPNEPSAGTADYADPIARAVRTSTAPTTSAPPPSRHRKPSPPRPFGSSATFK